MQRQVFFNGKFVPENEARLSIFDSALMFGDMVFEMTRSFNQKQFMLKEHLERLFHGLKVYRISMPYSIDELMKICDDVIEANRPAFAKDDEHRLMIDITRGTLGIYKNVLGGHMPGGHDGTNVIVADFPLRRTVRGMGEFFDTGINAVIPEQRQIPADLLDPKIKNRSRVHYLMANLQISSVPGSNNWALLIDPQGFVTEGTGANFFIVKENTLITSKPENVLNGISRAYVMTVLAKQLGLEVIETDFEPKNINNADEAFFTATPFCILPVTSIHSQKIGTGKPGKITSSLLDAWSKNVSVDIIEQIKSWDKNV